MDSPERSLSAIEIRNLDDPPCGYNDPQTQPVAGPSDLYLCACSRRVGPRRTLGALTLRDVGDKGRQASRYHHSHDHPK